jgi:hypothetical protein
MHGIWLQDLQVQVASVRHAQQTAEARLAGLEQSQRLPRDTLGAVSALPAVAAPAAHAQGEGAAESGGQSELKVALEARESSLAQLQERLAQQQAQHAHVEQALKAQLQVRNQALAEADKRFGELEGMMRRISLQHGIKC